MAPRISYSGFQCNGGSTPADWYFSHYLLFSFVGQFNLQLIHNWIIIIKYKWKCYTSQSQQRLSCPDSARRGNHAPVLSTTVYKSHAFARRAGKRTASSPSSRPPCSSWTFIFFFIAWWCISLPQLSSWYTSHSLYRWSCSCGRSWNRWGRRTWEARSCSSQAPPPASARSVLPLVHPIHLSL